MSIDVGVLERKVDDVTVDDRLKAAGTRQTRGRFICDCCFRTAEAEDSGDSGEQSISHPGHF
jgi:hypothetical protein